MKKKDQWEMVLRRSTVLRLRQMVASLRWVEAGEGEGPKDLRANGVNLCSSRTMRELKGWTNAFRCCCSPRNLRLTYERGMSSLTSSLRSMWSSG